MCGGVESLGTSLRVRVGGSRNEPTCEYVESLGTNLCVRVLIDECGNEPTCEGVESLETSLRVRVGGSRMNLCVRVWRVLPTTV